MFVRKTIVRPWKSERPFPPVRRVSMTTFPYLTYNAISGHGKRFRPSSIPSSFLLHPTYCKSQSQKRESDKYHRRNISNSQSKCHRPVSGRALFTPTAFSINSILFLFSHLSFFFYFVFWVLIDTSIWEIVGRLIVSLTTDDGNVHGI